MLVTFEPLSFRVVSFFFGAMAMSGGVQHVWGGVRAMMLLLAKTVLLSSSSLQSLVVFAVDGSGMWARLTGRVVVAF